VKASSIHFVAVIKGIPLKIRSTADYPGDVPRPGPVENRNEASVDSELAVLAFMSHQISGPRQNPYFQNFRAIGDFENATMLLVCRLDAPAAATVAPMSMLRTIHPAEWKLATSGLAKLPDNFTKLGFQSFTMRRRRFFPRAIR